MSDSKAHWLAVHEGIVRRTFSLGVASSNALFSDPKMLGFMAARYKFVSKLLGGMKEVVEVGCGDAFGAPVVAKAVGALTCTDIDEPTLADNRLRLAELQNIKFRYHDFREGPLPFKADAAYCVDVIEHIFPDEEPTFLKNVVAGLADNGVFLVGTPNLTADAYASELSRKGHVNLKDQASLRDTMTPFFNNVFMFGMNDEVVHTGFAPMAHYIWALCVGPKRP